MKGAKTWEELADQVRAYLRVVQQRPRLAAQFFEVEPVSYATPHNRMSLLDRPG